MPWKEIWFMLWPARNEELKKLKRDILKTWGSRCKHLKREIGLELFALWRDLKALPGTIKRRVWNKHLLLWWHRLWIRENEFDRSLRLDPGAILEMDEEERKKYIRDLVRRRNTAHERDLAREDAKITA